MTSTSCCSVVRRPSWQKIGKWRPSGSRSSHSPRARGRNQLLDEISHHPSVGGVTPTLGQRQSILVDRSPVRVDVVDVVEVVDLVVGR